MSRNERFARRLSSSANTKKTGRRVYLPVFFGCIYYKLSRELFRCFFFVLFFVRFDLLAGFVLFLVYLFLFLGGQLAAVGFAVGFDLLIDVLLLPFDMGCFAGSHFAVRGAVADAPLLILGAFADAAHRGIRRSPVIFRGEVGAVLARHVFVGQLLGRGVHVLFVFRGAFLGRRYSAGAARPALEAAAHADVFVDHSAIDERVVNDRGVYVDDRGVVGETPAAPFTAHETHAAIAESVIHAAVETDVWSPVAGMPAVNDAGEAPVTRRPEQADARRSRQNARNRVVASVAVCPVAGNPKIAFGRARRLHVNGQRRGANVYGDAHRDLRGGRGRHGGESQGHAKSEKKRSDNYELTNSKILP